MTKDEISQFLTEKLFGECWHDRMVVTEWQGDHEAVICKCLKCARESDEVFANSNFFTPDGMMKVIEAMRAKFQPLHFYVDDQWIRSVGGFKAAFTDAGHHSADAKGNTLPEAVCRAAVAFLKKANNNG